VTHYSDFISCFTCWHLSFPRLYKYTLSFVSDTSVTQLFCCPTVVRIFFSDSFIALVALLPCMRGRVYNAGLLRWPFVKPTTVPFDLIAPSIPVILQTIMSSFVSALFQPLPFGAIDVGHRIVMAPLTRFRAPRTTSTANWPKPTILNARAFLEHSSCPRPLSFPLKQEDMQMRQRCADCWMESRSYYFTFCNVLGKND
jgi:hypothetical protein